MSFDNSVVLKRGVFDMTEKDVFSVRAPKNKGSKVWHLGSTIVCECPPPPRENYIANDAQRAKTYKECNLYSILVHRCPALIRCLMNSI